LAHQFRPGFRLRRSNEENSRCSAAYEKWNSFVQKDKRRKIMKKVNVFFAVLIIGMLLITACQPQATPSPEVVVPPTAPTNTPVPVEEPAAPTETTAPEPAGEEQIKLIMFSTHCVPGTPSGARLRTAS
jgi:hypothetical protein